MEKKRTEEMIGYSANNGDCCKHAEVPSDAEVAALNSMREIKTRVKELKKRLSEISLYESGYFEEKSRLEKEMTELKFEWSELEEERKSAAHERMILLGYEKS